MGSLFKKAGVVEECLELLCSSSLDLCSNPLEMS